MSTSLVERFRRKFMPPFIKLPVLLLADIIPEVSMSLRVDRLDTDEEFESPPRPMDCCRTCKLGFERVTNGWLLRSCDRRDSLSASS